MATLERIGGLRLVSAEMFEDEIAAETGPPHGHSFTQPTRRKWHHAYSVFLMASPMPNCVSTVPVTRKPHET